MTYRFGLFEFDDASGELKRQGRLVRLEPQPARALALLVSRAGSVVAREEMRAHLWNPGTHVDFERGLAVLRRPDSHRARRRGRESPVRRDAAQEGVSLHRAGRTGGAGQRVRPAERGRRATREAMPVPSHRARRQHRLPAALVVAGRSADRAGDCGGGVDRLGAHHSSPSDCRRRRLRQRDGRCHPSTPWPAPRPTSWSNVSPDSVLRSSA